MSEKIICSTRKHLYYTITYSLALFCSLWLTSGCENQNKQTFSRSLRLNFLNGEPPCLHPHFFIGHTRCECLGKLLFECLTRSDAEGNVQLTGAKSVTVSPDGMQYVFTLRESRWSDGSPVTAFQYENAWKEAIQPASLCARSDLFYVIKNAEEVRAGTLPLSAAGVKALDARTLCVDLAFPVPVFLKFLSHPAFAPLQQVQGDPPHYNGAFVVDAWNKGVGLKLKKNPYFFDAQRVSLDTIEISFVSDPTTACQLYQKGELDWVGEPMCPMPDEIIHAFNEQKTLLTKGSSRVLWLPFNITQFPLDSVSIRKALSLVLDREAINQYILLGEPIYSPLPVNLSFYKQRKGKIQIERARELFQRGLREKNLTLDTFPLLTLRYCGVVPGMKELAVYVKEAWQKTLGITIQVENSDWNSLRTALTKGDFQIGCFYDKPYYLDPINILERFESANSSNPTRWTHPVFQEKIAHARLCNDLDKRNAWMQELEQILMEEVPVIPISNQTQTYAHSAGLTGYIFDDAGYVDFSFAKFGPK